MEIGQGFSTLAKRLKRLDLASGPGGVIRSSRLQSVLALLDVTSRTCRVKSRTRTKRRRTQASTSRRYVTPACPAPVPMWVR